ncbi:MAG: hypothetical protein SNJ71_00785 [Bacteroidales bacterium]
MSKLNDFYRGDTVTIRCLFKQNGVAKDITNSVVFFTVKKNVQDADNKAIISKKITNHTKPLEGETYIILTASDTNNITPGQYFYDVQLVEDNNVFTVISGTVSVLADITRRVT